MRARPRRAAKAFLRDRLSSAVPTSSAIEAVECRATLCRMQLVHADIANSNQLIRDLFIGPEATIHGATFTASDPEPTSDGRVRLAIFVPRAKLPE